MTPPAPLCSILPLNVAIAGADGKMGQMLLRQVALCDPLKLVSALVVSDSPWRNKTVGALIGSDSPIVLQDNLEAGIAAADVLIDFTRPEGTLRFIPHCLAHRVAMVVGTTGFDAAGQHALQEAAKILPMVVSTNMAIGVNVLFHLVKQAARLLPNDDAEIIEIHHRHKVDAPSGTALTLGEQVLLGRRDKSLAALTPAERRKDLMACADLNRQGETGARANARIGFSAVRGGDVVGEHTVMFMAEGERLEIRHVSTQRNHYARGAMLAAQFLRQRPAGLYSMQDVLQLGE